MYMCIYNSNDLPLCIKSCKTELNANDPSFLNHEKLTENMNDDEQEDL